MLRVSLLALAAALASACGGAANGAPATAPATGPTTGIHVVTTSKNDFQTTLEKLTEAIEGHKLSLMATIDHADAAREAGLELAPTTVLVFGNPKVGTALMQESRSVAIDLPLKILVYQRDDGGVDLVFVDPEQLASRHHLAATRPTLQKIRGVLDELVRAASQ